MAREYTPPEIDSAKSLPFQASPDQTSPKIVHCPPKCTSITLIIWKFKNNLFGIWLGMLGGKKMLWWKTHLEVNLQNTVVSHLLSKPRLQFHGQLTPFIRIKGDSFFIFWRISYQGDSWYRGRIQNWGSRDPASSPGSVAFDRTIAFPGPQFPLKEMSGQSSLLSFQTLAPWFHDSLNIFQQR